MLGTLVDTVMVMGLTFGAVALVYVVYALLHLPLYLLGWRK
jgi:hypothetical protein